MRSAEEVGKEIGLLKEILPYIPAVSAFDDDNVYTVESVCEVLLSGSVDVATSRVAMYNKSREHKEALMIQLEEALEWYNCESAYSPSGGWVIFKPTVFH